MCRRIVDDESSDPGLDDVDREVQGIDHDGGPYERSQLHPCGGEECSYDFLRPGQSKKRRDRRNRTAYLAIVESNQQTPHPISYSEEISP